MPQQLPRHLALLSVAICLALSIGIGIPAFHELLESTSSQFKYVGNLTLSCCLFFVGLVTGIVYLFLIKKTSPESTREQTELLQFDLRTIFLVMTGVALLVGLRAFGEAKWVILVVTGIVLSGFSIALFRKSWQRGIRWLSYAACLFLPYAWILPFCKEFGGRVSGFLTALPVAPGIIPSTLLGFRADDDAWLAAIFTMCWMIVGVWSSRNTLASYIMSSIVLLLMSVSSFLFYVVFRAI